MSLNLMMMIMMIMIYDEKRRDTTVATHAVVSLINPS
jgi:hypothetical protein